MFPFITNLLTNRYWTLLLVVQAGREIVSSVTGNTLPTTLFKEVSVGNVLPVTLDTIFCNQPFLQTSSTSKKDRPPDMMLNWFVCEGGRP